MLNICGLTQNVMKKIKGHLPYPPKLTGVFLYNLLCQTTNVKHTYMTLNDVFFLEKYMHYIVSLTILSLFFQVIEA